MEDTGEISPQQSRFDEFVSIPKEGEFGERFQMLWGRFKSIRENEFYAADQNRDAPRFNGGFAYHGIKESDKFLPPEPGKMVGESITYPPSLDILRSTHNIGTISSSLIRNFRFYDDETTGCADFYIPGQLETFASLMNFYNHLIGSHSSNYTMDKDRKSTVTIAYDTSRPELQPLLEYAMTSGQPAEELWMKQYIPRFHFPDTNMEHHLAIPVGLPANYIEYVMVNEKSPYITSEYLEQLRSVCVVDGHKVPVVSIHTGEVIK